MVYEKRLSIKTWSEADRPREKLVAKGSVALSDAELLAILIGSGNSRESAVDLSRRILLAYDGKIDRLGKAGLKDLEAFQGIGPAKAVTIMAALELGRRRNMEESVIDPVIRTSRQVADYFRPILEDLPHEEFWMLLLNRGNHIIDRVLISRGGVSGTTVDLRIIFKDAFQNLASYIVLCHNHPSGNLRPSQSDIDLTHTIKEAGRIVKLPVVDHIIISPKGYFSFADEGMI